MSDDYHGVPPITVERHPKNGSLIVVRGKTRYAIDDPRGIAEFNKSEGIMRDHIRDVGRCPAEHVDRLAADHALHRVGLFGLVRELKGGAS